MTLDLVTAFFGWCTLINIAVLLFSTFMLWVGGSSIPRIHARLFGLDEAALAPAYFQYLAQYKIVTLTMNFAPYIALKFFVSTAV